VVFGGLLGRYFMGTSCLFHLGPFAACPSGTAKKEEANDRLALGIKMNILLFLPGAWVVLFQIRGLGGMLESTAVIALIQVFPSHQTNAPNKAKKVRWH